MNWTLHCGDARSVLATLPSESVNCIVTSPPYFGLRDYGTATWAGGDPACDHVVAELHTKAGLAACSVAHGGGGSTPYTEVPKLLARSACPHCGAQRIDAQIGLEPTPEAFTAALVSVFAEARRVLRDDGTFWLNLGDSYANDGKWGGHTGGKHVKALHVSPIGRNKRYTGLKPKDLIGIPWRVAFALQEDGWYLRSDVIWSKPNPMPESVTDRPTKAHEYVFLLTKSAKYWYNQDAIRLPLTEAMLQQMAQGYEGQGQKNYEDAGVQNPSAVKARIIAGMKKRRDDATTKRAKADPSGKVLDGLWSAGYNPEGANARTVWQIPTEPSPYEHFAVMPSQLARRCISAGCPRDGVVLDPFAGVATTGVVALEEGRSFVGIELSPKYHAIGRERLAGVAPLLASEIVA